MAHVDALSRSPIIDDQDCSHLLDILIVGTDDWLATYQQSDDDIKRIAEILNDPKTKDVTEIFGRRLFHTLDGTQRGTLAIIKSKPR
ncbi:hypothetical protein JYU34_020056 [Plutella xylostella]|uniref:Uncharacterized protein n=1 Tax=Plutella xylostella TaxID=51655 RepID=A0ABQ7PWH5_PLUXY|nr:hypothetical protein JYU34_020056 [Plutella xylostella]